MKKIAYLILAHTDLDQFGALCKALDNEYNDLYVHIDAKQSNIEIFKAVAGKNVYFLEKRVTVSWGGISMIDAQNLLLRHALTHKHKFTHMVFISGSCYPIKNTKFIYETLTQRPGYQFIKYFDMRESPEHYMKQITQKWFMEPMCRQIKLRPLKFLDKAIRKLLNKVKLTNHWDKAIIPYFGSQWCALTPDCCQYIIDFQDENPHYREMNKYTFSPDEHFFHTIIGNSEFATNSAGVQSFVGRGTWRFANLHIIDKSLSKWFTVDDWEEVANSDKLFLRKIRSLDGAELVDRINRELLV